MSHKDNNTKPNSHQELELLMMDYISGRMSPAEATAFDQLVADNPEYSQELVELKQVMALIDQHNKADIPEPSAQMDQNFYSMLHTAVKQETGPVKSRWQVISGWVQLPQVRKVSYAFSFLVVGLFMGHYMHLLNIQTDMEAERLAIKDQQIQALTVLSLLDMPSANKRMMAVNLAAMAEQPTPVMVEALLTTLNQDSNSNVRLEALEVLALHTDMKKVRSGLIASIEQQKSPMVQVAIANLMLNMNESDAVKHMRELLKQPDLVEPVRAKLNNTINELI